MRTEQKPRDLPIIEVDGISFYVDGYHGTLIDTENKENMLFAMQMKMYENRCEFVFDQKNRKIYEGDWYAPLPDGVKLQWIRPIEMIDPVGVDLLMEEKFGVSTTLIDNDLPVIKIKEADFFADVNSMCFRNVTNRWNQIPFSEVIVKDGQHGFYYNEKVKGVAFPHEVAEFKRSGLSHISFVNVPDGIDLAIMLNEHKKQSNDKQATEDLKQERSKRKGKGI